MVLSLTSVLDIVLIMSSSLSMPSISFPIISMLMPCLSSPTMMSVSLISNYLSASSTADVVLSLLAGVKGLA